MIRRHEAIGLLPTAERGGPGYCVYPLAALLVLPLLWAAQQLQGRAPRLKWLFHVGYPVHLALLALLAATFAR